MQSLLTLSKSNEEKHSLIEIQSSSTKLETLINHCASLLPLEERQELLGINVKISVSVRQLITYAEYNQPFNEVIDTLLTCVKEIEALAFQYYPKIIIKKQ